MGLYLGNKLVGPSLLGLGKSNYGKLIDGTLTYANISEITNITDYAFYNLNSLESVKIEKGVKSIGKYAFSGTSITTIIIPKSVRSIDITAFNNCPNLETIIIKNTEGLITGSPWGATNAQIIWDDSTRDTIDLTEYSFDIINDEALLLSYNGYETSIDLPDIIEE